MKNIFSLLIFINISFIVSAQKQGFPFGKVTYSELDLKVYEKDTTAVAVVLNEFGEAYIENGGDYNLIFEYHVKIKILKKAGLTYADIEIPLGKSDSKSEVLRSVKASAFTMENGSMQEIKLLEKNVFTENRHKYLDIKKFAIPDVREGSVIEFQYTLESPFLFKFRSWDFQSDIPKVYSEYVALVPGNYTYNQTLRGFQTLSKNTDELVKDCFSPGGQHADCIRYTYAMRDIPSFVEEDYMTAKTNYLSSINFELSEIRYFDGRIDKVTKEWKDAEQELRSHREFGAQLRRGKDIVDEHVEQLIAGESDQLVKAKKIYDFIRGWYRFNEVYMKYSELGIKKAFDQKTGNVGDINLSLIAALRYAGLDVEPVILSTRANGLPIEIHPVLSDFNYVIAKVNIGEKIYLADATDDFHPFGLLPERCLNGKGRVLGEKESYWIELKPADRAKKISVFNLKLENDGVIRGSIQTSFIGYEAVTQRKKLYEFNSQKEYIENLQNKMDQVRITGFEIKNVEEFEKPLVQKLEIEISIGEGAIASNFMFSPFILGKWEKNPFRSNERLFPVDFGTAKEYVTILNLEYPTEFEIVNLPEKKGLLLPNAGGRFVLDVQNIGNRLSLNSSLTLSKAVFSSLEYHYLKELFNQIIQVENGDLIFKKKV